MNAERFDALSQIVTIKQHRRGVVRALLGLTAGGGLLSALSAPASAGKQRNQSCGPCQRRKKGRCRGAKPNGAPCGECGECRGGVCVPGKVGCGACQECDATARCRVKADDASCGTNGKCLDGICNEPPTCTRAGVPCSDPQTPPCCSGICQLIIANARFCVPGTSDALCLDNDDCAGELRCVGYRCG